MLENKNVVFKIFMVPEDPTILHLHPGGGSPVDRFRLPLQILSMGFCRHQLLPTSGKWLYSHVFQQVRMAL